jgi:hypothetical protein
MSRLRQSAHGSAHLYRSPSCIGRLAARRSAPRRKSRYAFVISRRGALRPTLARAFVPLENGGRRESRMPVAPAASCASKKAHELVTTGSTGSIRLSPREGFNGFFRALPGEPGLLSPSSAQCASIVAHLTPASGRQDHTASPSAFDMLVSRIKSVHRIPPHVRDDGQRPSDGRDARSCRGDLPVGLNEIFLLTGLDTHGVPVTDLPDGQITNVERRYVLENG